jgi:hypothetical protein
MGARVRGRVWGTADVRAGDGGGEECHSRTIATGNPWDVVVLGHKETRATADEDRERRAGSAIWAWRWNRARWWG